MAYHVFEALSACAGVASLVGFCIDLWDSCQLGCVLLMKQGDELGPGVHVHFGRIWLLSGIVKLVLILNPFFELLACVSMLMIVSFSTRTS